ncbi:MAG: 2Fe-2S iron-sulfur cluster binding domain-containing protein [Candidatus Marinimicrobia bacterium]|nr:2Fe-2S iron-sulfur cluster binding domain-containing protein [Candidatus Neomarinimicrobiota bacterium]
MKNITISVNHTKIHTEVPASQTLLDFLRSNGIMSVKRGCESGECGACAVLVDDEPRASCITLTLQADGKEVKTVDALSARPDLSELQKRFIEVGAIQCGYCIPALLLLAEHYLSSAVSPSEKELREAISGVLCRCTGYVKPIEAIKKEIKSK